jgi:hypothetical protein
VADEAINSAIPMNFYLHPFKNFGADYSGSASEMDVNAAEFRKQELKVGEAYYE